MNVRLIMRLVGLRYRLLWAKARSRNGKIALFCVGALFGVLMFAMAALGGFGAALAAVKLGKAEMVARVVFGGSFLFAVLASLFLGIGVEPAFSDAALRQYPLTARERLAARHVTALLEPLWLSMLALDVGMGAAFSIPGVAAAVLLWVSNYLFARVLLTLIERASKTSWGPLLVLGVVATSPQWVRSKALHGAAEITPPFLAAAGSLWGLIGLLVWCAALAALFAALERRPAHSRTRPGVVARWDTPYDRVASLFGSELAPLLGKMLRYYARSPQVRFNYPFIVPGFALMALQQRSMYGDPMALYLFFLGGIGAVGGLASGAMSLNMFGFDGAGLRRYLLLPVAPATILRAAGLTAMLTSGSAVALLLLAWMIWSPVPTTALMMTMLVSSALGGLFFF